MSAVIYHICTLSRLDGEHVVFGKVIQGMDYVYAIEGGAGTYSGKPRKKVTVADSGEIPKSKWDEETWRWSLLTTNFRLLILFSFYGFQVCFDTPQMSTCMYKQYYRSHDEPKVQET